MTFTIQNVSESSDVTTNNSQSFTITKDSNAKQMPTRNITQDPNNDPNQDNKFTLSKSNIFITQPLPTQQPQPRNFDQIPIPPQNSHHPTPLKSPQQVSSNASGTFTLQFEPEIQFQTPTPTRQPVLQPLSYTPAQNKQTQKVQPGLTIFTLQSNT